MHALKNAFPVHKINWVSKAKKFFSTNRIYFAGMLKFGDDLFGYCTIRLETFVFKLQFGAYPIIFFKMACLFSLLMGIRLPAISRVLDSIDLTLSLATVKDLCTRTKRSAGNFSVMPDRD